jgi:hypothetical protein
MLVLEASADELKLAGPVTVNVTLQATNITRPIGASNVKSHYNDVYSYNLIVPAGHEWQYSVPENAFRTFAGANQGFRIIVRPGYAAPAKPVSIGGDLPCDLAVGTIKNLSEFFPSPCEPCAPGMPIGLPPTGSPMVTPPAAGGCIRPRYFNGMFITREDLETDQRFFRLKNKMQNRAMGQGVVWGLNVSRTSSGICVHPGYAVDCCGNDLVVTEGYHVNSDILMSDPGVFQFFMNPTFERLRANEDCGERPIPPRDPQQPDRTPCRRMHLLLEYVECPEQPRPVHGDPCSPAATSCEMSRIRETVRLRLIPPRDYDPTGPIDRFLKVVADIAAGNHTSPGPSAAPSSSTTVAVPFSVRIQAIGEGQTPELNPLNKLLSIPPVGEGSLPLPDLRRAHKDVTVTLRLPTTGGYEFTAGKLRDAQNDTILTVNSRGTQVEWTTEIRTTRDPVGEHIYKFEDFEAQPSASNPSGATIRGSATIRLRVSRSEQNFKWVLLASASAAAVASPRAFPCLDEACSCGDGPPRFPVFPPFLHNHPLKPTEPVDWKVVIFAAIYAWITGEIDRLTGGSSTQTAKAQAAQWKALYEKVALDLFELKTEMDVERVTKAIRCLLEAWCTSLLYPGPQCAQGIHGVVIGCATIQGGRIVDVDPWGGRRWVLHYPLLTHWGHQFGIAPLDLTASRLFGLLCCVAHLPIPQPVAEPTHLSSRPTAMAAASAGSVHFFSSSGSELNAALTTAGIRPAATRELPLLEFIAELLMHLRTDGGEPGVSAPYVLFKLKDGPNVSFAAPVSYVPVSPVALTATDPRMSDRLREVIRTPNVRARAEVPALIRSSADELAGNLLAAASLTRIAASPVAERLANVGIGTVDALLSRDPEVTSHSIGEEHPQAFTELLAAGEGIAARLSAAVYATVASLATENRLFSETELAMPEQLKALRTKLVAGLREEASIADITAAVESAIAKTYHVDLTKEPTADKRRKGNKKKP